MFSMVCERKTAHCLLLHSNMCLSSVCGCMCVCVNVCVCARARVCLCERVSYSTFNSGDIPWRYAQQRKEQGQGSTCRYLQKRQGNTCKNAREKRTRAREYLPIEKCKGEGIVAKRKEQGQGNLCKVRAGGYLQKQADNPLLCSLFL